MMEVIRTVPVKLDVSEERRDDLHQTIQQFNYAADYTVEHSRDEDGNLILNKYDSHVRDLQGLHDPTASGLRGL